MDIPTIYYINTDFISDNGYRLMLNFDIVQLTKIHETAGERTFKLVKWPNSDDIVSNFTDVRRTFKLYAIVLILRPVLLPVHFRCLAYTRI